MCSHKLKIENIFILLPGSCPRDGTWGCWGVKNFSMGICDGAPSTARSSLVSAQYLENSFIELNKILYVH